MRRMMMLAGVVLTGCSGPYRVAETTATTISICYDPLLRYEQRAANDAEQFCRARNMTAVPTIRSSCGLANVNREVTFECRSGPR